MTPRTLKEVAQAGLILGFEWIARDSDGEINCYASKPHYKSFEWRYAGGFHRAVLVSDYPDLPPEKSLLALSDIVEDKSMSEWKKLTAEQVAWLDARAPIFCDWLEFRYVVDGNKPGWHTWELGEFTREAEGVSARVIDRELRPADFPMGEAVTESPAMRMASDRAKQAEQEQASVVAENPWVYEGFDLKSSQIKSMYDIQNEQAKAQADAEWQKERRAAWVAFASATLEGAMANPDFDTVTARAASNCADRMLAEFDKRFGEGK